MNGRILKKTFRIHFKKPLMSYNLYSYSYKGRKENNKEKI